MRTIAFLLLALLCSGCQPTGENPNDASRVAETSDAESKSAMDAPTGEKNMHTDAYIESLVDNDINALNGGIDPENQILSVVPSGESHRRAEVFRKLNLNETKLTNFRTGGINMVDFLTWQVSPSYDITCMSANNDPENSGLEMADPNRKVYGIRLSRTPN